MPCKAMALNSSLPIMILETGFPSKLFGNPRVSLGKGGFQIDLSLVHCQHYPWGTWGEARLSKFRRCSVSRPKLWSAMYDSSVVRWRTNEIRNVLSTTCQTDDDPGELVTIAASHSIYTVLFFLESIYLLVLQRFVFLSVLLVVLTSRKAQLPHES